jgi:putative transposase
VRKGVCRDTTCRRQEGQKQENNTSLAAYSTQWSHGSVRFKLTYKAERLGMEVHLQEEAYTSRTCPKCLHVRSKVTGRVFRCTNRRCRFVYHRDGVGSINIRRKYLGQTNPVVGVMAPPTGLRFRPQARVARLQREAAPL